MYRNNNVCTLTSIPFTPGLLRREWSILQHHADRRKPGTLSSHETWSLFPIPLPLSIKRDYWSASVHRRNNVIYQSHKGLGWQHRSGNKNSLQFLGVELSVIQLVIESLWLRYAGFMLERRALITGIICSMPYTNSGSYWCVLFCFHIETTRHGVLIL